jgi:hypothetical protein
MDGLALAEWLIVATAANALAAGSRMQEGGADAHDASGARVVLTRRGYLRMAGSDFAGSVWRSTP